MLTLPWKSKPRLPRGRLPALLGAAALAATAGSMTPALIVQATVTCSYPAFLSRQDGSTFSDGVTPSAGVNVNECDGGTPYGEDGDWHDQYQYWVYVGGQNESDVRISGRAWACGSLVYDYNRDWSDGGSFTSDWFDYGKADGNQCNEQYDMVVKVTAWSGQQWASHQRETDGGCSGDGSVRCEPAG